MRYRIKKFSRKIKFYIIALFIGKLLTEKPDSFNFQFFSPTYYFLRSQILSCIPVLVLDISGLIIGSRIFGKKVSHTKYWYSAI